MNFLDVVRGPIRLGKWSQTLVLRVYWSHSKHTELRKGWMKKGRDETTYPSLLAEKDKLLQ